MVAAMMKPAKRILFCATTSDWGGVQLFLSKISKSAQSQGDHVLVAAGGNGELEEKCKEMQVPYTRLEHMRRAISPLHDLAALHELRKLIREFRPDVIHLNSSKMSILGSFAADIESKGTYRPRVIYRIGGWVFEEHAPAWKKWMYIALERWTARKKDVIVTVHPGDEEVAKQLKITPRDRIVTIPNGIDLHAFDNNLLNRATARKELHIPDESCVVGIIANFYPPKNIPWLMGAIRHAKELDSNIHFTIIGDGPERARVESELQRENDSKRQINLTGRRTDAAQLLPAFDIFLLPSTKEGMPWTLLEAMAARLPCVATDVGACSWMLKDGAGVIIPPNDAHALVRTLNNLSHDQQKRKELGERARATVESRFTWIETERKTLRLFS